MLYDVLQLAFIGSDQIFLEICLVPLSSSSSSLENQHASSSSSSSTSDFLRLDFTVDLVSYDAAVDENAVLCKFRPSIANSTDENQSFFRRQSSKYDGTAQIHASNSLAFAEMNTPEPRSAIPDPQAFSPLRSSISEASLRPHHHHHHHRPANQQHHPLSQSLGAPGIYSMLAHPPAAQAAATTTHHHLVSPPPPDAESLETYFPSRVVLAQQMQIDALSREVEELKALVMALRGSLPHAHVHARRSQHTGIDAYVAPDPSTDDHLKRQSRHPQGNSEQVLSSSLSSSSSSSSVAVIQKAMPRQAYPNINSSTQAPTADAETLSASTIAAVTIAEKRDLSVPTPAPAPAPVSMRDEQLLQEESYTYRSSLSPTQSQSVNRSLDSSSLQKQLEDYEKYSAFYEESEVSLAVKLSRIDLTA
jgi:hypothetical protein